jgi:hypothetical protein
MRAVTAIAVLRSVASHTYHGIALLTNTRRDPQLMAREARRRERWIDVLA